MFLMLPKICCSFLFYFQLWRPFCSARRNYFSILNKGAYELNNFKTRTVFSEENVCPTPPPPRPPTTTTTTTTTSLNRPIVEKSCIYNLFFCFRVCGRLGHFRKCKPSVALKMGLRSLKSNQFLSLSQEYNCTSLVKIYSLILEIGSRKAIFQ